MFSLVWLFSQKMARGLSNLETINLSGCEVRLPIIINIPFTCIQALTDACMQVLAFNCQLLTKVYLAACPLLGDSTAKYLAQGCTWIQYIDLSGTGIT